MQNHTGISACYLALAESMNSFSAKTKTELKVRCSNLAENEFWLKLEILVVSVPKPNFGRLLIYTYVHTCKHVYKFICLCI